MKRKIQELRAIETPQHTNIRDNWCQFEEKTEIFLLPLFMGFRTKHHRCMRATHSKFVLLALRDPFVCVCVAV